MARMKRACPKVFMSRLEERGQSSTGLREQVQVDQEAYSFFSEWGQHIGNEEKEIHPNLVSLYQPYVSKVFGLFNPRETTYSGVNTHHFTAVGLLREAMESDRKGGIYMVTGPMGAGKSAVLWLLSKEVDNMEVNRAAFCHSLDLARTNRKAVIQTHGNRQVVPAQPYDNVEELIGKVRKCSPRTLVLVDEWQFALGVEGAKEEIKEVVEQNQLAMVIAGLDFSFKREPWPNTKPLLDIADRVLVLTSRCTYVDCPIPASFTQLDLGGKPASRKADLVRIGKVNQEFFPRCAKHHRLEEDL